MSWLSACANACSAPRLCTTVSARAARRSPGRSATPERSGGAGVDAERLRAKSRDLVRRNAWAAAGIEAFVSNAIGTGIKPQSMVADNTLREAIHSLWWDWCEEADAAGLTDFYGLQALACRAMLGAANVWYACATAARRTGWRLVCNCSCWNRNICRRH